MENSGATTPISEMQGKLARWSTADKERKFNRLLRLIANEKWLLEAARITLASSGAKHLVLMVNAEMTCREICMKK